MPKPIVLIHGAWHNASCFSRVSGLLIDQGYDVHSVDMPLTGVEDDVQAARQVLTSLPGCVVLGHSYGGLVITHAAVGVDIAHLVYLAALMPDQDEDVNELVSQHPSPALAQAVVVLKDGRLAIDPELAIPAFYHDCEETAAKTAARTLRPQRFAPFPILREPPAWRRVPSTYVVCEDDRAQHPDLQRVFAARATQTVELAGSHSPFLARPDRVAAVLKGLAAV